MNSSNNCSLVCRITEVSTGMSYMATGDTELARWSNICRIFSGALRAHVMAAPHHGSDNGVDLAVMQAVSPHTVLVSCGIGNQYGHPGSQAAALFTRYATEWYCTAQNTSGKGQSLVTTALPTGIVTQLFSSP
jgi:beta-lactamase superfamily II metal-dependent hydrolase